MQQTHLELEALYARRTDFAQQLEILTNRRGQLADQIAHTEPGLRAAPQASLSELDARITRLEKEAAQNDNQISELLKNQPAHITPPPTPAPPVFDGQFVPGPFIQVPSPGVDPNVMRKALVFEAAGFLLLTAILCRWTWQRAKARFAPRQQVDNNTELQHAVDAIAIEVERISEGQRFVTNLLDQRLSETRDARPGEMPRGGPKYKSMTPV